MTKSTDGFWIEMFRLARRLGRRMNVDGDDLAQSLAAAYLAQQGRVAEPGPWLERVARNLAVEAWRRQRRESLAPSSWLQDGPEDSIAPAAWENLVAAQERRAIERACQALDADERALLARRFDEPAPGAETAPPRSATERTRLRRVLVRLRHQLASLRAFWAPGAGTAAGQGMAALALGGQMAIVVVLGAGPVGAVGAAGPSTGQPTTEHRRRLAEHGPALGAPRLAAKVLMRPALSAGPRPTPWHEATASGPARAPSPPASAGPSESPATGAPAAVQRLDFEDDAVEGELQSPDAIFVPGLSGDKKASLIELRRDFVPELLKALDDVG